MKKPLIDGFGRIHNNLRIGVTDRCNLRCTYCMPEDVEFLPRDHLLTFEEIDRFAKIAASLGVNKIRLTGGEPLMRSDLHKLVAMLFAIDGIDDIALTTNGLLLAKQAADLYAAGLRRLNVSLDTLDAEQFRAIARRGALDAVLDGLNTASRMGFGPIKLNAVAMKNVNENQIVPLARFCRDRGYELRFIEFMPLEADGIWDRGSVLSADDILRILADADLAATSIPNADPHAPAEDYQYTDGGGRLGIIASVTKPFCGSCNRIRLTSEGKLRNCLFAMEETDIKTPMRAGADDDAIEDLVRTCVAGKWEGHQINSPNYTRPLRTMHTIGG